MANTITELAQRFEAEAAAKRRAEQEARLKAERDRQQARLIANKRREAKATPTERERLIAEALAEAAQKATAAAEAVQEKAQPVVSNDGPRARLATLVSRYPRFGNDGVDISTTAEILGVTEGDVRGLIDGGTLANYTHTAKTRTMDENGIILPPKQTTYAHLVTIESLQKHVQ